MSTEAATAHHDHEENDMTIDTRVEAPYAEKGRPPIAPPWAFPVLDRLTGTRPARVAAVHHVAAGTVHVQLDRPRGYEFRAGQFALLRLQTPSGPDLRPLSLAGSPESDRLEFATRVGPSAFKQTLAALDAGQVAKVSRPIGGLRYDAGSPAVLIAGGTGITPLRSLLLSRTAADSPAPIHLLFSNRQWDSIPFRDELAEEADRRSNLRITWVLTATDDASGNQSVHHGRITPDLLSHELRREPDAVFYVAGPARMTTDVTLMLRGLGVPRARIRRATQGRR